MDTAKTTAEALDAASLKAKRSANRKPRLKLRLHKARKESTKTITTRLYKLWSELVHIEFKDRCAVTGSTGVLDAHHIMPRQVCSGLRFDPKNGILLCKSAHKFGKYSAHKGGIWFAEWLKNNMPDRYKYCLDNFDKELDCKDRLALYAQEDKLHKEYSGIDPLPQFRIIGYTKDMRKVESVITAYNAKAAEYIFAKNWPKDEKPIKGIWKITEERQ